MSCPASLARRVNPHVSLAPQLTRHDAHAEYRGYRSIVDVWLVVASFALIALIGPGLFEELLEARIEDAETVAAGLPESVVISAADLSAHVNQVVEKWKWHARPPHVEAAYDAALVAELRRLGVSFEVESSPGATTGTLQERVAAIRKWFDHDWMALDEKLRSTGRDR